MSGERISEQLKEAQQKLKEDPKMEHYTLKVKEVDGKEEIVVVHKYINGR